MTSTRLQNTRPESPQGWDGATIGTRLSSAVLGHRPEACVDLDEPSLARTQSRMKLMDPSLETENAGQGESRGSGSGHVSQSSRSFLEDCGYLGIRWPSRSGFLRGQKLGKQGTDRRNEDEEEARSADFGLFTGLSSSPTVSQ